MTHTKNKKLCFSLKFYAIWVYYFKSPCFRTRHFWTAFKIQLFEAYILSLLHKIITFPPSHTKWIGTKPDPAKPHYILIYVSCQWKRIPAMPKLDIFTALCIKQPNSAHRGLVCANSKPNLRLGQTLSITFPALNSCPVGLQKQAFLVELISQDGHGCFQ